MVRKARAEESGERVGETLLDLEPGMEAGPEAPTGAGSASFREESEPEPYRSGVTRRQLILGAGGLAVVGGAWWLNGGAPNARRRSAKPAVPSGQAIGPGPRPLWVHRDVAVQTADGLTGAFTLPVFVDNGNLLTLDPVTGAGRRRIDLSEGEPQPEPGEGPVPPGANPAFAGGDRVFDSRIGRIRSFHLTDPAADWQLSCPPELGGPDSTPQLMSCDDGVLYGMTWQEQRADVAALFALAGETGRPLWVHQQPEGVWYSGFLPVPGGRLLVRSGPGELVSLKADDGARQWSVQAGEQVVLGGVGPEHVYTINRTGGVQAIRLADGGTAWALAPEQSDTWRYLRAVAVDGDVLLLRDDGRIARHDPADGKQKWAVTLPFRIDSRCCPVPVRDTLYVPGPADQGVRAIDIHTGEPRWQFRDSASGVQYWSLGTDGSRLFAGHDTQLYGLPIPD
ncbi:outer membrane protein assembly factor BamB family protein [Kitasatospora sp. HPMI-4]|uniref:outer membrane protein assembly factor BamB family protein n=1 Tax=Kitasatospora sp. HPMI-4 TaxID=3448443 RepID=UPI003F19D5C5